MKTKDLSRRQFLERSAGAAGALLLTSSSWFSAQAAAKRTAVDQVALGKTGLKLSRLGFGTGSNSGNIQHALGQEDFNKLIHYAYDQGITYFDCAQSYRTFEWIGGAIKGLPREKLFLQSKVPGKPDQMLAAIDRHRKVFDTDYVDSMLIHCMVKEDWTDEWKRIMDAFDEAKEKKWIRAKGVSCHSLPALRAATASNWTEVHLVASTRKAQPHRRHGRGGWDNPGHDLAPVLAELKAMRAKGRGVIGMKIIGNGEFTAARGPREVHPLRHEPAGAGRRRHRLQEHGGNRRRHPPDEPGASGDGLRPVSGARRGTARQRLGVR